MNPISPFLIFIRVSLPHPLRSRIHPSPVFSFLIIHFPFLTTYFSRITLVVSWRNKQCCEYGLQLSCVLQARLASRASVAREPYKCGTWIIYARNVSNCLHKSIGAMLLF